MHILAAIIGFIGMALFWWYRLRDAGRVAGEAVNQVGIMRGKIKRKALLKKAGMSPITAIDNPLIAAATLLISIQSEEFELGELDEEVISRCLLNLADTDAVDEAMVYGKWANQQILDRKLIINTLGKLLSSQLNDQEKLQFLDLCDEINIEIGGSFDYSTTRTHLASALGAQVEN